MSGRARHPGARGLAPAAHMGSLTVAAPRRRADLVRVAFVTSEVHPFSKTGGLADVSESLPAALAELGVEVTVFSPLYAGAAAWLADHGVASEDLDGPVLWIGDEPHPVGYRRVVHGGHRVVFVVDARFYDRPRLYAGPNGSDYPDNAARFAYLCRAALEYFVAIEPAPDVVHAHDWQAGLVPVYLHTLYQQPAFAATRSLFTIHNLGYQGLQPAGHLAATGLDWSLFHPEALEFYGQLNLLKGGIVFADAVTTVSPTYAEEIQTPALGHGLDGVLRAHGHKLTGILNGIDVRRWDPATDPHLPAHFDARRLAGKAACKRALQERAGLPVAPAAFVLGTVGRFDRQKGTPLIADAFTALAPLGVQLVVLGAGDPAIALRMHDLARAYPRQVAVADGFDEPLAHLIEAGADAFLMPSAYEPCGLNQMYSQRYGTVPIVHATGGLKDTVADYTPERLAAGTASGFRFDVFDAAHLAEATLRAWRLYTHEPIRWRRLMQHGMRLDHSWSTSARAYAELYARLTGRAAVPSPSRRGQG